jgi:hypothetical protein
MKEGAMSSEQDTGNAGMPIGAKGTVVLTRRLWDWYFVVAITVASVAAFYLLLAGGGWQSLKPFGLVALWLAVRFQTPKSGIETLRLSATAGAARLLAFCAFGGILTAGIAAVDVLWIGSDFTAPIKLYQLALYLPLFILLIVGMWIIEKRYMRKR